MVAVRRRRSDPPPGLASAPDSWRKIFIIGPPGSGKTFWARRVSQATGIRWYELDDWLLKAEDDPERTAWQDSVLAQDAWIIEGIYPWADAMAQADAVLLLRPPWWVRDFRIVWHRYLWPGAQKLGRTVWRMAVTLRTSHRYAHDHEVRTWSSAERLGIYVRQVASGQHLLAEVLSHQAPTSDTGPPTPTRA